MTLTNIARESFNGEGRVSAKKKKKKSQCPVLLRAGNITFPSDLEIWKMSRKTIRAEWKADKPNQSGWRKE